MVSTLALIVGVATSAGLTFGAGQASAITASPCTAGYNCGPQNVQFWEPGAYPWQGLGGQLDSTNVCDIEGSYSSVAASAIDTLDDPAKLDTGFLTAEDEGNYTNNEVFSFKPASLTPNGTPDLSTGSHITISLPRPTETYPDSGAVLPNPSQINVASLEPAETLDATITAPGAWDYDSSSVPNSTFGVTVNLPAADAGDTITLSSLDPNNAQPAKIPTGQSDGNVTINGYEPTNGFDNGHQTVALGTTAYFQVQLNGSGAATIVLAATDTTSGNEIANTATVNLNGGLIGTSACSPDLLAPPLAATTADPYLLFRNGDNVGYPATAVTVGSSAGVESATIQVPPGLCPVSGGCTSGDTIYVDVLDALSPPGSGTNDNAAQSPLFPASDFTIATSDDPVPAAPSTAPAFIGDFNDSQNITDPLCFPYSSSTSNLVDPCDSTLVPSENSLGQAVTQVTSSSGNDVTTTLRDAYNNPVNDHEEEVFQTGATHAVVSPQAPPATQNNQNPAASQSGDDGTASFEVTDSCVETVNLEGVDTSTNQPFPYSHSNETIAASIFNSIFNPSAPPYVAPQEQFPAIQFTAGSAIAPDSSAYSPAECSTTRVKSSVAVTPSSVPADGASTATVTVTLGDQYGNAVSCQPVELIQPNATHATVVPLTSSDPCPAGPAGSPTTSGPGYSGLDGKATFTVSDADAESVVFGVVASSSWPTDPVADPTDVAVVNFLGADPAHGYSTVTASRNTGVPGNGFPSATVTVTLLDSSSQPEQNKKVTLATTVADPTSTITPASATTNASGQAVFTVADDCATLAVPSCTVGSPHYVTYQATDVSDGVTLVDLAIIAFTPGGASLIATPGTVVADGHGSSVVTFNLFDPTDAPVNGASVSLATSGSAVVTPSGSQPTSGGMAQFTVTDTKAETVTLTATATYPTPDASTCQGLQWSAGTCTVTISTTVVFTPAPTSLTLSPPTSTAPADGITSSEITLTALNGTTPVGGLNVRLGVTGSPGNTDALSPATATTNANGVATFQITDTVAETVTVSAQYESDTWRSVAGSTPVTVVFTQTANEAEAQNSTITPSATASSISSSSAPADGHSTILVTVNLFGLGNLPLNGHSVVLNTGSSTTNVQPSPTSNVLAQTKAGAVSFTVTDTTPETLTLYAIDVSTGVLVGPTATITFVPTEALNSTVGVSPPSVPAGGLTTTVTVTLLDPLNHAISGHTVSISTGSATTKVTPLTTNGVTPAVSNASGVAQFTVSDSVVETVHITAVDVTDGMNLVESPTATFAANEANQSTVTINPVTNTAYGPPATLTVVALGANGQPLAGEKIAVLGKTGTTTLTPLLTTGTLDGYTYVATNAAGVAQFWVSDTAIESETLSACDLTVSTTCTLAAGSLLDETATVSFGAGEANQSSVTESATSMPAEPTVAPSVCATAGSAALPAVPLTTGITCPTPIAVTVTLKNAGDHPIVGDTVQLSATSATVSSSIMVGTPASAKVSNTAVTGASGTATFYLRDSKVEANVGLTALDLTTGAQVIEPTPLTVSFTADEANQSTFTAGPGPGATQWTISVTLKSATGTPLVGHTVKLTTGSKTTSVLVLTAGSKTTAAGLIQFRVTDSVTQTLSILVTDSTPTPPSTTPVELYQPVVVTVYR